MKLNPMDTAPKGPLDGLRHGPSILLHVEGHSPMEAWWSEGRKCWSTAYGPVRFHPAGWSLSERKTLSQAH